MTVIMRKATTDLREKVWKVIRGLIEFTYDEVTILTESRYPFVSSYLLQLYHAGYIRPAGFRKEGNSRKKKVWRLARNTGPKAPIPCSCIYDPNIDDGTRRDSLRLIETEKSQRSESPISAKSVSPGGQNVD